MKTYKDLYSKITSIDNILEAHSKARKNKTRRKEVKAVDEDVLNKCVLIQEMLINHTYKTSPYHTFKICEPKERIIFKLPYFPDRIVHHAIMNITEKIWVDQMIPNTFSCIKHRGIHAVVKKLKHDLKKDEAGTKYCLKLDIRKFYPSINHDILKKIIRIKIADRELLQLLDEIIDSAEGVPIGNYLSQFFANLYLAYFDKWVVNELSYKYYYRYADDIVILHNNKEDLHQLRIKIQQYLQDNLKLELKSNYQVYPVESRGIDFVGYVFRHKYVLIRKSIKAAYHKKNSKLNNVSYDKYKAHMASYVGWFSYANCYNLINKTIKYGNLLLYYNQ